MSHFNGKRVAVIGLSVEGLDSIKFFLTHGATVLCCDRREKKDFDEAARSLPAGNIEFHLGDEYLSHLDSADLIVRSPGVLPSLPELVEAKQKGIVVSSQTQLFMELCTAPIIGVTGTKGKGTTSTLIYEILAASGIKAYLGGNVGTPLLSMVDSIHSGDWVVLELSSFQLEDVTVSPHIAVVLRITKDHIANFDTLASNFHRDRDAYVKAKKPIVAYQKKEDTAIVCGDDETAKSFSELTPGTSKTFSRYLTSVDCYVQDHTVFLKEVGKTIHICSLSEIQLLGDHNLENIAAATLAARAAGVSVETIAKTVKQFKGLEHRLEVVKTVNEVLYINDSFSTVPETTIAAIETFNKPIVLILGGSEKGSDFTDLGKVIASHEVKVAIVIGQMTQRIVEALKQAGFTGIVKSELGSMHEVVTYAHSVAKPGDVVLLSPACASFGMFANYKDRAKQFKSAVHALKVTS